ncbi:MAG: hypothetical protein MJE66_00780 [Proteobacteria bacterium]|nr:hypothetical protein [Pseudomonadota bacterium]
MEIVEVWLLLGAQIHQDFLEDYPDLISGLRFVFASMSDVQRSDLLSFLMEVTEGKPSAGELAKVWYASGADLYVQESDVQRFFELLLSELKNAIGG